VFLGFLFVDGFHDVFCHCEKRYDFDRGKVVFCVGSWFAFVSLML
jgi:hypothetical protein